MLVTDWRVLADARAARDCRLIRAEIRKVEGGMARAKDQDRGAYLRLCLLHARLMRTVGRKALGRAA